MPSSAQTILLKKLTAVLADLQQSGASDGEAMFMLGAGTDHFCSHVGAQSWAAFRQRLTPADIASLLPQIDEEGRKALAEDKPKHAYALQALGLSLTATAFADDEAIRTASGLLDEIIERAYALYRQHGAAKPQTH